MKKILPIILLAGLLISSQCWADGYETALTVNNDSIYGDFQIVTNMADGFWKTGISGIYTEDNDTNYKWAEVGFTVGSDAFYRGLTCEVGLKGLLGKAEDNDFSGDVGAVAFTGRVTYDFAQQLTLPGSFKVFGGIDYANKILSFQDTEDYMALHLGLGVPLFEHASVIMEYSNYDMDMNDGPGHWSLNDDEFRIGLSMKF